MALRPVLLSVLALLTTAGCIHASPPRIAYSCSATLTTENGEFYAGEEAVGWIYRFGDGIQANIHLPHAWQSREDFRAYGWGRTLDAPGLVIVFTRGGARNVWTNPTQLTVFGEIRVDAQTQRQWVSETQAVTFAYSQWNSLLTAQGDLEVTLFGAADTVLQRAVIPRSTLDSIIPTLQRLTDEVTEMERDPPARCEAYDDAEIVVT
jgi:hypothetical protein